MIHIEALKYLLKFTPNFYLSLFFIDLIVRYFFTDFLMHSIQIFVLWLCVLFFLPKFWCRNSKVISV